jgi:archaellum component FlaC
MEVCIKTNVDPINEEQQPTTPSTLQLSTVDGSQSELGSLNTVNVQVSSAPVPHRRPGEDAPKRYDVSVCPISLKQAQVNVYVPFERRPGGGAPNRYDTNLSSINFRHQSDLDMSFASMDLTSDLTPSVEDIVDDSSSKQPELSLLEQALTSRYEEKNRRNHQNRSRSQNFTHQRTRSRRRSISLDTQRHAMMCGPVHEIQESVQDVTYSIQQIIRSIRQFGPKERDAVMETLHEAEYFIRQKCKPEEVCGPLGSNACDDDDDVDDDTGRAGDDTKNRSIVMIDNLINLVGSEISLTNNVDDSKTTIYGTRSSSDLSDQYMSDISSVVYKMPIDTNIFRSRRPGCSRRF